jgi:hypothetical protein
VALHGASQRGGNLLLFRSGDRREHWEREATLRQRISDRQRNVKATLLDVWLLAHWNWVVDTGANPVVGKIFHDLVARRTNVHGVLVIDVQISCWCSLSNNWCASK